MKKQNIHKEQLKVQKKILKEQTEHKEISKKQLEESIPLKEQRIINYVTVGLMIAGLFVGGGILTGVLQLGEIFQPKQIIEYDVDIQVSPNKILLNEKNDLEFEFTLTNIGNKNLTNFKILSLYIFREKDKKRNYLNGQDYRINCYGKFGSTSIDIFEVGNYCKLKVKMYTNSEFFDDKDNPPQFLIYIESTPPIENKIVNITIY